MAGSSGFESFAASSGIPPSNARAAIDAIGARLPALSPEQHVALLQEAGFDTIALLYAGFTFKGWVTYTTS